MNSVVNAVVFMSGSEWSQKHCLGLTLSDRLLEVLNRSEIVRVILVGHLERKLSFDSSIEIGSYDDLAMGDEFVFLTDDIVLASGELNNKESLREFNVYTKDSDQLLLDPKLEDVLPRRVVDDASLATAKANLLNSLRKPIDGLTSRYLNRHVSLAVTPLLLKTGWAPNTFTLMFLGLGLLAAYFATFGQSALCLVLAGVLVQSQSILDGCDGEMARLTYRFSKSGQWLDSIGDDITNYAFCFGLAYGQYSFLDKSWIIYAAFVVLAMQIVASGLLYKRMIKMGTGDLLAIPEAVAKFDENTRFGKFAAFVRQIMKRDTFVFGLALLTVLQMPLLAFILFGVGTAVMFFGVLANERALNALEATNA